MSYYSLVTEMNKVSIFIMIYFLGLLPKFIWSLGTCVICFMRLGFIRS